MYLKVDILPLQTVLVCGGIPQGYQLGPAPFLLDDDNTKAVHTSLLTRQVFTLSVVWLITDNLDTAKSGQVGQPMMSRQPDPAHHCQFSLQMWNRCAENRGATCLHPILLLHFHIMWRDISLWSVPKVPQCSSCVPGLFWSAFALNLLQTLEKYSTRFMTPNTDGNSQYFPRKYRQ